MMYFGPVEPTRRRPGWRPGIPVVLADGHAWHLPPLTLTSDGPDGRLLAWGDPDHEMPAGFFTVLYEVAGLLAQGQSLAQPNSACASVLAMFAQLLRVNYDLGRFDPLWLVYDSRLFDGYGRLLVAFGKILGEAAAPFPQTD